MDSPELRPAGVTASRGDGALIAGLLALGIGVLAAIIAGVIAVVWMLFSASALGDDNGYGLGEPEPGVIAPSAESGPREVCVGECFSIDQAQALLDEATGERIEALAALGARDAPALPASAGPALDTLQATPTSNAQCRALLPLEPVVRGHPVAGSGARDDAILDLGSFGDESSSVRVVARVFETPERAESYIAAARYALNLCGRQVISTQDGDATVTTLPAKIIGYNSVDDPIVVDRETTHIGWQHDGGLTQRGDDLQHGNLVVRVTIDGTEGPGLDEAEVSALLLNIIERLEALEPVA